MLSHEVAHVSSSLLLQSVPAIKGYLRVQAVAFEDKVVAPMDVPLAPKKLTPKQAADNMSTAVPGVTLANYLAFASEGKPWPQALLQ